MLTDSILLPDETAELFINKQGNAAPAGDFIDQAAVKTGETYIQVCIVHNNTPLQS